MMQGSGFDRTSLAISMRQYDALWADEQHWLQGKVIPLRWRFPSDEGYKIELLRKMALTAHYAIENLSSEFKETNAGKLVVISYDGGILAVGDTIREINATLREKGITKGVHMERIGQRYFAKTSR
jgi:hypothetical protein